MYRKAYLQWVIGAGEEVVEGLETGKVRFAWRVIYI